MISHINSRNAFIVCGILLPVISVIISIAYFRHRGFIQFGVRSRSTAPRLPAFDYLRWPLRQPAAATKNTAVSDTTPAKTPLDMKTLDEASV